MLLFRLKEVIDSLFVPVYKLMGKRPWSLGYYSHKKTSISDAIDHVAESRGTFQPGSGYGYKVDERVVEYPWSFSHLPTKEGQKILDAGSTLNYQYLLEKQALGDSELTVMTLSPEKRCHADMGVSYVFGDLRDTIFGDEVFDVILSISTIEHIGMDNAVFHHKEGVNFESSIGDYSIAVKEFHRILAPGGTCILTVPCGKHMKGEWYQIFDSGMISSILEIFEPSSFVLEYFGYKPEGWLKCDYDDIRNADFFDVNLEKGPSLDGAAGSRGIACLKLVK
ncbi:class I SAM-dependent methyltransferase [Pseudomonadales bacterium]|nr:class I SAM-dependent methyltransferase [Pseudomonadales bacterium]